MRCSNCDNPNPDTARFCVSCGATLRGTTRIVQPPPAALADTSTLVGADTLVGVTIDGKYRLDEKMGSEGPATVYRAKRLLIDDAVAVKVVSLGPRPDPASVERVRREAQATSRLNHPNIVATFDFGVTEDGLVYLVQELVEGKTLRTVLLERHTLDPPTILETARQVGLALDEAHANSVIHRNIKPENIILSWTEWGLSVKVLDFGVAQLRDISAALTKVTPVGTIVGTPKYMSPEQCLGERVDGRSDLYSLGTVLYEALCGTTPFDAQSSTAVLMQQVEGVPRPPRAINPSVPPAVEAVIMRTLEKDRELRPPTGSALAEDLAAAYASADAMGARHFFDESDFAPSSRRDTGTLADGGALPAVEPPREDPAAPRRRGLPAWINVLIPILLVSAVAVAVAAGYVAKSYLDSRAARRAVLEEIDKGNLVTPVGSSAFDLYAGAQGTDLGSEDRAAVAAKATPALEQRGEEIVARLRQENTESDEDWSQAVRVYTWLNQLAPNPAHESRLYYAQARLAFLRHDYERAVADYRKSTELDGSWALPFNGLGRAYARALDLGNAKEAYRRATEVEPDWVIAWLNYGSVCLETNDLQNAELAFRAAARLDPSRASTHNLLARTLERANNLCDALGEYKLALDALAAAPSPGLNAAAIQRSIDRLTARRVCPPGAA